MIHPSNLTRWIILGVVGIVFAIPILAMLNFSFNAGLSGGYTLDHWTGLFSTRFPAFFPSTSTSRCR